MADALRDYEEYVEGDDIYLADNFDFIYSQVKNLRKKLEEAGSLSLL